MLISSPKVFQNREHRLFWARVNSCKYMLGDLNYCANLNRKFRKKTYYFFPVCISWSFFIRVLKVNTSRYLHFHEKRWIFRKRKYKNGITQLTEKHSNKELFLAGARAAHQRGYLEYHSQVKNIIEFIS